MCECEEMDLAGANPPYLDQYRIAVAQMMACWVVHTRSNLRQQLQAGVFDKDWKAIGLTEVLREEGLSALRERMQQQPRGEPADYFANASAFDDNVAHPFWDPDDPCCPPNPILRVLIDAMLTFVQEAWNSPEGVARMAERDAKRASG